MSLKRISQPKKKVKVVLSKAASKQFAKKYLGDEPTWTDFALLTPEEVEERVNTAYNWYNYYVDLRQKKEYLLRYVIASNRPAEMISAIRAIREAKIEGPVAYIARMIGLGYVPSPTRSEWFEKRLAAMIEAAANPITDITKPKTVEQPKKVPIDRVAEATKAIIADLEDVFDRFLNDEIGPDFSVYEWFRDKDVKQVYCKAIASYYEPQAAEVEKAVSDKRSQEAEGYRAYSPKKLKELAQFIRAIVDDAMTWAGNKKAVRKATAAPRPKKAIPAEKIVQHLKYEKENTEFKVVSAPPTSILGVSALWVFNTRYKLLIVYRAKTGEVLGVRGSALTGWDEDSSVGKRLRKPEEIVQLVVAGKYRQAEKLFEAATTNAFKPNGRINENTILLKPVKN